VYLFGTDPVPLGEVVAALPALITLLFHPDIQAAGQWHTPAGDVT
jgi:hypothetical protein